MIVRQAQRKPEVDRRPALTLAAWAALPEDEPGEFVDGRLEEEEKPDLVHELVVAWLVRHLGNWFSPRGGFVFGSEVRFVLTARRGRKPDVAVYFPGARALPRRGPVRTAPDIAVEVLSPTPRDGRRDRIEKAGEYAKFGVRYYWIVDPEQQTIEILERGRDGRYVQAAALLGGSKAKVPGCTGLLLDIDDLWREIDRLR